MSDPHYVTTLGDRFCKDCGFDIGANHWNSKCTPESPCYCCLAAEVERLTAIVQRVTDLRDTYRRNIATTMGGYVFTVPLAMVENSLTLALIDGATQ